MQEQQSPEPAGNPGASRAQRDLALVTAAQDGDSRAFGELVEAYQRRVYALAYGILRHRDDAWDVAQETFVKAYRNLASFRGQSAFYTWLYRIAYNLSMDNLRARGRREVADVDQRVIDRVTSRDELDLDHPLKAMDRKELREVLARAMDELSEKHRAIIVLREIEGLSYEEMADVLKISKGTVMSRLFHARKNLQRLLTPYLQEGDEGEPPAVRLAPQGA